MAIWKEKYDIILLQEHWLWSFESQKLANFFPDHDFLIKCADDEDNIPNDVRLHGKQGTAILWKKSLSHLVSKHPDGSERINVVTFQCNPQPICIINVYLPPNGSKDFKINFSSHLDQIFEIVNKFHDHIIILGGDMNGSLLHPKYPHDFLLKSLLEELKLMPNNNYPDELTFFSNNGSTRQIDYILTSHPDLLKIKKPLHIPTNTSDHCPIPADLDVILKHINEKPKPEAMTINKIDWEKTDILKFKSLICQKLQNIQDPTNIEDIHEKITENLYSSAAESSEDKLQPRKKRQTKIPISQSIKEKLESCRKIHKELKKKGLSVSKNPTLIKEKRSLRRAIRIELAIRRNKTYKDLMIADSNKDKLFYKLISKQRKTKQRTIKAMRVNGEIINDQDEILEAWAHHFHKLGTPSPKPQYDEQHQRRIKKTYTCISKFINVTRPFEKAPPVSLQEVESAVKKLNNGKAPDKRGLTAEHLKYSLPHILQPLATLYTSALHNGIQPQEFSIGTITPIGKKDKDHLDPNNHRGIVLSAILAKVYEHIIDKREEDEDSTDPLQFGFTKGRSPIMASLITTETISESLDADKPIYIASLDTQKAFDVVWQESLAVRLFIKRPIEYWQSHTKLLEDTKLQVKLNGSLSDAFIVSQGVGQGKILSTKNYKDFIEPALSLFRKSRAGCHIGIYYTGSPTCADDILLIANSPQDLQLLLSIAYQYSSQERYNIHPDKTKIIIYNNKKISSSFTWKLGDTLLHPNKILTHLGINRYASCIASTETIEDRIKTARRTAYSLFSAGFHGISGLNNQCLKRMLDLFIMPVLLYGLESLIISDKQKSMLEEFLKDILKRIQSLPTRTANEAAYLLFNYMTAEGALDYRLLCFLGKILSDKSSILYQICLRQLAIKDMNSNSWFIFMVKLSFKYGLPSPHDLILHPMKPTIWKKMVKLTIRNYWKEKLESKATTKTTLQRIAQERPTWEHVEMNPISVDRARLQSRFLTDTITLQYHRSKFYKEDPTCRLCGLEDEDVKHMLMRCPSLSFTRQKSLKPVYKRILELGDKFPDDDEEMIQVLLGFTSDRRLYRCGANACYAITHFRNVLHS